MGLLENTGRRLLAFMEETGKVMVLLTHAIVWGFRRPLYLNNTIKQMLEVGVNSIPVVLITATFTGMVLALQTHTGFQRFNAESLVGTVVALSMTRELGPVLTGLIVAGRAGSAMAAELGTMRVTEQIDALYTLATNPVKYLVVPRLVAGVVMLPVMTILSDIVGIYGGLFVSVSVLDANRTIYIKRTWDFLEFNDVYSGLFKAAVFGLIISLVGCYKGFYTRGGAEGVGKATTGSVVISSMLILIFDYLLTAILF
ncbi:MAG: ABC transporter permease [bacterium]|nr:ABC transporter permease [bacterium]